MNCYRFPVKSSNTLPWTFMLVEPCLGTPWLPRYARVLQWGISMTFACVFSKRGCQVACRFVWFALCIAVAHTSGTVAAPRPNVLFIAVDDLRPQLNSYGKTFMRTPNMDRLASRGVLFERAYCMVPTCGASRASLMTGIRPAPNRFVNYLAWAEKDAEGITTLNTHFKNHGYNTVVIVHSVVF